MVRRVHTHTTLNNIIPQENHSGNAFLQKAGSNSYWRLGSCLQQPSQHSILCVKQETVEAGRGAPAPGSVPGWALGAGAPQRCPRPPHAEGGRAAGMRHHITASDSTAFTLLQNTEGYNMQWKLEAIAQDFTPAASCEIKFSFQTQT